MNLTGDLAPTLAALGAQLPTAIKALTDAGQTMEAQALASAHDDLTQIFSEMDVFVTQVDAVLTKQREALLAALDARLNGLTLTNKLTYPGSGITL